MEVDYKCKTTDVVDFSILDELENWRDPSDSKFTLKLVWPAHTTDSLGGQQVWRQTTNPVTSSSGGVDGYEPIDAPYTEQGWGGLEHNGVQCLMDGQVDHTYWFYAVGAAIEYGGGIPGACQLAALK